MAPERPSNAESAATAKHPSSQRSISSFFGTKQLAAGVGSKKALTSKTKEALKIPSIVAETPAKCARLPDEKKCCTSDNEVAHVTSSPTSPDSPGAAAGTKLKDWVSTPSPSEPAKFVTKTFGRRDKNSFKPGFVAPVSNSAAENPSKQATNGRITDRPTNRSADVGRRLEIYWPLDNAWYPGQVMSYNEESATHVIRYDDGEEEALVLLTEKVKWLDGRGDKASQTTMPRKTANAGSDLSLQARIPHSLKVNRRDVESVIDEPKIDADESPCNHSSRGQKRARLDIEDENPATIVSVSGEVFDDVDIAVPVENQEVMVRKRLRKMSGHYPRKEHGKGMEIKSSQEDEDDSSEKEKARVAARRLRLSGGNGHGQISPFKPVVDHLKEGFGDGLITPNARVPGANQRTIRRSDSREKFRSSSSKTTKTKNLFFTPGAKLAKNAGNMLPVPSVEGASHTCKGTFDMPKVLEADKVTRGELHSTLIGEAAERFGGRVEETFKFLGKGRRDGSRRRPSDPDYDPRTVLLPKGFLEDLSGGQRQWWEFKSKHMDKVLFFKVGKFYELFEMDAHVGAQELDLQYMKGDQPHCGFPEKNYSDNAERLARKGYRVLVVEQTETPEQLEQRKKETGAKDKVVRREVCAVLTKGTLVDGEMLLACPDAAYLMSITEMVYASSELAPNPANYVTIGVCFVDTSTSHIQLGQFVDDSSRSRLRSILLEMRPVELIKPRGILSEATEHAIRDHTRQPLINILAPGIEFWDAERSLKEILNVYASFKKENVAPHKSSGSEQAEFAASPLQILPEVLQRIVNAGSLGEATLSALGGSLYYLRDALLDQTVLKLGRVDLLQGSDSLSQVANSPSSQNDDANRELESTYMVSQAPREPHMIMDSTALENLEILENNSDGGPSGTLLAYLDACVTPCGRRLLKQWLVRPLIRIEPIVQRQLAILDLKNAGLESRLVFRKELKSQPDVERLVARLNASSGASGRNGENVVLYEDAAKKLLHEFLDALSGCRALIEAMKSFGSCISQLKSDRLRQLVTPGVGAPDMARVIEHIETAFDRVEAERTGRIVPREGVDEDFDEANSIVETASEKLAGYLVKQRKKFNNSSEIKYVTVMKEAYQMEIPEKFHAKVPSSFEMRSSRKGFQRYWTPEIKEYLQELIAGEQKRELALRGILQGLVRRFCEDSTKWLSLVKAVAEVDVLICLSEASINSAPTCRPTFVMEDFNMSKPSFTPKVVAKGLRHPTVSTNLSQGGAFVPNDVALGGLDPPFMLLTGPNMGGKSTLIRQVCLAIVLAQIGADVPADQFELSPVDQVFVRMGAKDMIMAGQSTFLVELFETASMLRSATCRSLVALDELGRGTSTADGQAIAHSVLQHLSHEVGCRGMFSTHYHRLADHFSSDSNVGLHHMSCKVGTGVDGVEEVIFLYKLAAGACPKSYGVNVARLAGMPESVLRRAAERAGELELMWQALAADDQCRNLEIAAGTDCTSDGNHQSGGETEPVKEIVALLKQLPADGRSDTFTSSLLEVWREAKQILRGSLGRKRQVDAEADQKIRNSA